MGSTRCRDRKARLGQPVLGISRFRALDPRGFRFSMVPRAALNRFSDSMTTEAERAVSGGHEAGQPERVGVERCGGPAAEIHVARAVARREGDRVTRQIRANHFSRAVFALSMESSDMAIRS